MKSFKRFKKSSRDSSKIIFLINKSLAIEHKKIGKYYKLKGNSKYFIEKYKTSNPIAMIDDLLDLNKIENNTTKILENLEYPLLVRCYYKRAIENNLVLEGFFYYAHIQGLAEIIHNSELDIEVSEKEYYNYNNFKF